MVKRQGAWIIASGAAVLVLGTGGVALAAGQSIPDSNGVIHGCYTHPRGNLRVINSSVTTCRRDETSLNWNQTGPAGPAGATGPSTAGPSGLDVIEVYAVPVVQGGSVTANCPASHPYIVGGGGTAMPNGLQISEPWITANQPQGWRVTGSGPGPIYTDAFALCAK